MNASPAFWTSVAHDDVNSKPANLHPPCWTCPVFVDGFPFALIRVFAFASSLLNLTTQSSLAPPALSGRHRVRGVVGAAEREGALSTKHQVISHP